MTTSKPCPGCDRDRKTCWAAPCAHLLVLKAGPVWKLGVWVAESGGHLFTQSEICHLESLATEPDHAPKPSPCASACGRSVYRNGLCIRCDEDRFDAAERALPREQRLYNP